MTEAVDFEGANMVFRAPNGMSQQECRDLPVFRDERQIISAWRLTPADLAMIQETGVIWLCVMGAVLPPVLVSVVPLIEVDGNRAPKVEPIMPIAPRSAG